MTRLFGSEREKANEKDQRSCPLYQLLGRLEGQSLSNDANAECPYCGRTGKLIHGEFLVFPRNSRGAWDINRSEIFVSADSNNGQEVKI